MVNQPFIDKDNRFKAAEEERKRREKELEERRRRDQQYEWWNKHTGLNQTGVFPKNKPFH